MNAAVLEIFSPLTVDTGQNVSDLEKKSNTLVLEKSDIEHTVVHDDPRTWSTTRKSVILAIVSVAAMVAGLPTNMQNPANQDIEHELHTSPAQISWTLSGFILCQGCIPLLWSAISEIKGRKTVYLASFCIFVAGSIVAAVSTSIGLLISMRLLQAVGSGVVFTIGVGTLADIYEPAERGSKTGLFYAAPVLAQALAPTLGGILTQVFNWRSIFWFMAIFGGLNFISFHLFLKDTFRRERSSTYQAALEKRRHARDQKSSQPNVVDDAPTCPRSDNNAMMSCSVPSEELILSLADVNPFPTLMLVLQRMNNLAVIFTTGLLFAFSYSITYTCARTLSNKYKYDALQTGLVLFSFGIGGLSGSILGGRWSDRTLARLTAENSGKTYPEMRLKSTKLAIWFFAPAVAGYAWICEQHVHVSAICVTLFIASFFTIWIYSSALAYLVDANAGHSSVAVAANNMVRGISAFVAAEVAVPLQDTLGDGRMYTLWAGLLFVGQMMIFCVLYKGATWRERGEVREVSEASK